MTAPTAPHAMPDYVLYELAQTMGRALEDAHALGDKPVALLCMQAMNGLTRLRIERRCAAVDTQTAGVVEHGR